MWEIQYGLLKNKIMKRNTFLRGLFSASVLALLPFKTKAERQNKVVEFTPEMLIKNNFGLYIINDKANVFERPDYAATVAWKLSYHNNNGGNYGKVNFLTDGWFCPIGNTYKDICEYLNNNPYGEKFRIMTKEELFYIINHRTNAKQLFYE